MKHFLREVEIFSSIEVSAVFGRARDCIAAGIEEINGWLGEARAPESPRKSTMLVEEEYFASARLIREDAIFRQQPWPFYRTAPGAAFSVK